jgi:tetratricopeptide (TPR) repeat protein
MNKNRGLLIGSSIVGVIALIVYILTLSSGVFPGEPARMVAEVIGVAPRLGAGAPIYHYIMVFLNIIGGGNVFLFNLVSSIFGALSVVLMYNVMYNAVTYVTSLENDDVKMINRTGHIAGAVSSLSLTFCLSFWVSANRVGDMTFHIFMLLLATKLAIGFAQKGSLKSLLIFMFFYGIGICEYSTFITCFPVAMIFILIFMWKHSIIKPMVCLYAFLALVVGLSFYLVSSWFFYNSPGYEIREYASFWHIPYGYIYDQFISIVKGLPKVGWLLMILLTIVPWIVMLFIAKRSLNYDEDITFFILHIVFLVLAILVLFDLQGSPWYIFGVRKVMILPYLLTTSIFGYVAAYFSIAKVGKNNIRFANGRMKHFSDHLAKVMILPIVACIIYLPIKNVPIANAKDSKYINDFAKEVVNSMDGRSWLLSTGFLDYNFMVAAKQEKVKFTCLDLSKGSTSLYLNFISQKFDNISLQNVAKIGLQPLLRTWFSLTDIDIEKELAILSISDFWLAQGYVYVPNKTLFLGGKDYSSLDADELFTVNEKFWKNLKDFNEQEFNEKNLSYMYIAYIKRHLSLVANNLGVLMQDLKNQDYAIQAYKNAIDINDDNISAKLNLIYMNNQELYNEDVSGLENDIENLSDNLINQISNMGVSYFSGYVREPMFFARIGWNWAMSGQPKLAVFGLTKAMEMVEDVSQQAYIKGTLASVYLNSNDLKKSSELFGEILKEDPENLQALLGLAKIARLREDYDEAAEYLQKASAAGLPPQDVEFELIMLEVLKGNMDLSKERVEKLLEQYPDMQRARILLSSMLINDPSRKAELADNLRELNSVKGGRAIADIIQGNNALQQKDYKKAKFFFQKALISRSMDVNLLETLLRLDFVLGEKEDAKKHVMMLLKIDPENHFANYINGTIQDDEGQKTFAENSYRKSIEVKPTPDALNSLAYLLVEKGQYEEAASLAEQALEFDPDNLLYADTYGIALYYLNRSDEALPYLKKAADSLDIPAVYLHYAAVLNDTGNIVDAKVYLQKAMQKNEMLPFKDKQLAEDLHDQLK